jgi:nucleoside phosphorylase
VTSREVAATAEAKAALFASTGAVAVDMESSLILAHAAGSGCPALVVRGVSDAANESAPSSSST